MLKLFLNGFKNPVGCPSIPLIRYRSLLILPLSYGIYNPLDFIQLKRYQCVGPNLYSGWALGIRSQRQTRNLSKR